MMHAFVIDPPKRAIVPVRGGGKFPVRRIFCVGRNYASHAREMGGDPEREPPFFFTKPADALVIDQAETPYPPLTKSLHHEIELVIAMEQGGANISPDQALSHVFGYATGLDLTRRDLQDDAKAARRPWDMSKGFDYSAPIGGIAPAAIIGHPSSGTIRLSVNGVLRQYGDLAEMIWSVPEIIAAISTYVTLAPGDLIFTGTPYGVATLEPGDTIEACIDGVGSLSTRIVKRSE